MYIIEDPLSPYATPLFFDRGTILLENIGLTNKSFEPQRIHYIVDLVRPAASYGQDVCLSGPSVACKQ